MSNVAPQGDRARKSGRWLLGGVGLAINALVVFGGLTPGSDAEERAIQRYMETHSR